MWLCVNVYVLNTFKHVMGINENNFIFCPNVIYLYNVFSWEYNKIDFDKEIWEFF